MFFSISRIPNNNFTNQYKFENFYVGTDNGWKYVEIKNKLVLYKGYTDEKSLDDLLEEIIDQEQPMFTGNFCILVYSDNKIKIKTDVWRSFPIYINHQVEITNLVRHPCTVWTDSIIEITQDFNITETKFDPIGDLGERITEHEGLDIIDSILTSKIESFIGNNSLPLKLFLSGGTDTSLIYSYIKKFTNKFEMIIGDHFDWDHFYMKNSNHIKDNWAYKSQIHHWIDPCVVMSGTPGDEFLMRGPTTCNMYIMSTENGKTIADFNTDPSNIHYTYFGLEKNIKTYNNMQVHKEEYASWDRSKLVTEICNNLVNDWQHWHLGNTLTWTPLRDLRITKTILRMPREAILSQILNADISKKLIIRNDPNVLKAITPQKNSFNCYSNLYDYYADNSII